MNLRTLVLALAVATACKRESVPPPTPIMNTFEEGQLVVYPGQGVVLVQGRHERDGKSYVELKHPTMGIHVPVENLAKAVRRPMPAKEAEALLALLRNHEGEPDPRRFAYQHRDVMRVLVKGSAPQQADALHRLYLSPYKPAFGERKLMMMLEDVLLGELVLATSTPKTLDDLVRDRDALAEQLHSGLPQFTETAKPRPKEAPLEPPRPKDPFALPDVEYLGTFSVGSGKIAAGDPGYVGDHDPGSPEHLSYVLLDAVSGTWHAYVRTTDDGVGMLFAFADPSVNAGEVPAPSREAIGHLWVDSGQMSILDGAKRADAETQDAMLFPLFQETLVLERGCMSSSGGGDGNYPVFASKRDGKVTWLAIDFDEEADGEATATRKFMKQVEQKIRGR